MERNCGVCLVRTWTFADLESLVRYANNRSVWRNLRDGFPCPYTRQDGAQWLAKHAGIEPPTAAAIVVDGQAVGGVGIEIQKDIHRFSAEIGYWLGEPFWGRGIATAALQGFTEYAFQEFRLRRLFAGVFAWNLASVRVLEKAGYRREGHCCASAFKDGRFVDEYLYARLAPGGEEDLKR